MKYVFEFKEITNCDDCPFQVDDYDYCKLMDDWLIHDKLADDKLDLSKEIHPKCPLEKGANDAN